MKVPPRAIEGFAAKLPKDVHAVLVYGPDEGLARERAMQMTKSIVPDVNDPFCVVELAAEQVIQSPSILLDEVKSISMLGGRRVVRLRDATDKMTAAAKDTLTELRAGDNLVILLAGDLGKRSTLRLLFEAAENAAALPCYADDARDSARVIATALKAEGWHIAEDALDYMAARAGGDRSLTRGEVEKLIIYMGDQKKTITLNDVTACSASDADPPLDDLARYAASGQFTESARVLDAVLSEGTHAVAVMRTMQNYFSRLHLTKARVEKGEDVESAMKRLRPPVFFKQSPAFQAQLQRLSLAQIEQCLTVLMSAEARCKQTASLPDVLAGRAILSLCRIAGRSSRGRD